VGDQAMQEFFLLLPCLGNDCALGSLRELSVQLSSMVTDCHGSR
jgi:hypothetical protein